MRISWINAADGRVIDSRPGLTGVGVVEQLQTWMRLTGEDDLIVVEDDRREAVTPEPLDFATEDGQTVGGFTVGADDPTPEVDGVAPEDEYRACVNGADSRWSCTRVAGHAGVHIAGTGHLIAAVWS